MSRQTIENEYRRFQAGMSAVYLLLVGLLLCATARAESADELRLSTSTSIVDGGRQGGGAAVINRDQYPALEGGELRLSPGRTGDAANDDRPAIGRSMSLDFWIYDADVLLFGDDDGDGYFYGIDLLFDADTVWDSAAVYAVTYLSLDGGPWNEYAVTDDFLISGASSRDEFVLVTELESGYPTGSYDLLVELYDAHTGEFLADFGPESSSALGFLSLEDFNRDAPRFDRPVAVSRGGGGSAAGVMLLAILATAFGLRRRGA